MNNFRNRIVSFMFGRYGMDTLGYFLLALYGICCLINAFAHSFLFSLFIFCIVILIFFRTLSKNTEKRRAENQLFCKIWNPVKIEFKLLYDRFRDRKTNRYRKCKHCKAVIKLPNKKGDHTVRCPKCGNTFPVKIL